MSIYDKSSLVLIPSGTKTGKVYSQKPVSGDGDFTFTRSSAATRVNADGFIEKETQNLLLQSNNFNTTWTLYSVTATSGQAGYDGSSDAWEISTTGVNGFENLNQNISFSGVHTISMYAKAGSNNYLTMRSLGTDIRVQFKLDDGTHSTTFGSPIDTFMEDAGGGWYRCGFTANFSSASEWVFYPQQIGITDAGTIYIQDAQLEQGLVARDYIETTTTAIYGGITDNVPRLDYTDSSCPALLLEPQRTNIIESSEYFDGSLWSVTNITITNNDAESPEGIDNASKIVLDSGSSSSCELRAQNNKSVTLGDDYTFSVFAKADEFDKIELDFSNSRMGDAFVVANLTNGTITSRGDDNTSDSIEDYGDGWYRIILTGTAIATGTTALIFRLGANPTGDGTSGFHIYGAQFEAGSYATSYIPTYGSSVTRVADVDCETANPDTSLFGQTEGTIFCEYTPVSDDTTNQSRFIRLRNSSNSNQIYMQHNAANNINAVVFNGSNQFVGQTSTGYASVGNTYKFALAYKDGDYAFYANGVQIDTGTATGLGTLAVDRLDLDNVNISKSSKVNQALVFKTRLSNEELAALTTI